MRILISPAKKMREDTDTFLPESLPAFLPRTERLKAALEAMSPQALQRLWRCNDAIAALNVERLAHMDLRRHLTPALFSYEGIQYRYLAPGALEEAALDYLREHLCILSGFYGLLRPFDGVMPYRLEMQARLNVDGTGDLYGFWGSTLAEALAAQTDVVVNLASREYSRAVEPHPVSCGPISHLHLRRGAGGKGFGKGHHVQNGTGGDGALDGPDPRHLSGGIDRI